MILVTSLLMVSLCANAQTKRVTTTSPKKPVTLATPETEGRNISITYTPYKNCWVYLGCYYGKSKTLADSAYLDGNSHGTFRSDTKLTGGIYFLVSPQYTIQFELLMDDTQHFNIVGDSSAKENITITGSEENSLFKEYTKVTTAKGKYLTDLAGQLAKSRTAADSARLREELRIGNKELIDYRAKISKEHPSSLLAMLFTVMKRPEMPNAPKVNGKIDSLYPYRFMKDHFWDDVNFFDNRLLRTPFFEPKVDDYFKYFVSPEPDSVINEVKFMLLSARTGKEIYPYLLTKFTNKYVNPEYMGQDKVFLYLFENFYAKGDTIYLNPESRKKIFDRAYSLMANQIGEPAPLLDLKDTTGKVIPLYGVEGKFTMVVFWDPHCGHCKEQIPRVDSFYQAKWKALGMKIYAVYIYDDAVPDWKKFINEKNLGGWVHVYQPKEDREAEAKSNQPNFRQLYDAHMTPTFYLLDDKKHIIAKQLSLEQFDQVIDAKLKATKQ
jgi:thiol-disulfide isomerase/thioredoxin